MRPACSFFTFTFIIKNNINRNFKSDYFYVSFCWQGITEVGWGYLGGDESTTLTERIREVQRLRKTGNLPPVYPNGWFAIIESRQVAVAQVYLIHLLTLC